MAFCNIIRLERGLTLDEALRILEGDDEGRESDKTLEIAIMPPVNATHPDLSDEDSGEEDSMSPNNLPGSMLRAEAELFQRCLPTTVDTDEVEESKEEQIMESQFQGGDESRNISDAASCHEDNNLDESKSITNYSEKRYVWKSGKLSVFPALWPELLFAKHEQSPLELFSCFLDNDVLQLIVEKSNRYAARKNKLGDISMEEMKCFIGILLLSGYVPVPRRRLYWEKSKDTFNEAVASALSRDRFEFILSNLHCCDNDDLDPNDSFAKVRPLFQALNDLFQDFAPHHENHSVDEAMVPYFGRHGCKQFIRGKPIRYGYKLWVGATSSGYVLWMEPYQGSKTKILDKYKLFKLGPSIVLQYADILQERIGTFPFHLFFDNFFTTVPLLDELKNRNLRGTGTIRENRSSNCPLMEKNKMKNKPRGFYQSRVTEDESIVITKWNDNSIVSVASNAAPVEPLHTVTRYSRKDKKKISITQPHTIHVYNKSMGGVDRCDENVSLYQVSVRGKKWYMPLITHCIDIAVQNAWQLHRYNGGRLDQLSFRRRVAMALLESNSSRGYNRKRSRPSSLENINSRYDRIDHLITTQEKQTRCRLCHKKVSTKCQKCNVALHVTCFVSYHTKD